MKQPIEDYLKRLKDKYGYSEEDLAYVREFRESTEHMTFDLFTELYKNLKIVKRTAKLKTARNIFVKDNGLFYLNHYHKRYCKCGYFIDEAE